MVAAAAALWLGARSGLGEVGPGDRSRPLVTATLLLVGLLAGVASSRRSRPVTAVALGPGLMGLFLLGALLSGRADAGYQPRPSGSLDGEVTVLDDPRPLGVAGWRVELRLSDGARIEATAYGRAGGVLARAGVGDVLAVEGRLREVGDRPWLRTRHIVARASIAEAWMVRGPGPVRAMVEAVRDRVGAGADTLDERPAALYRGLVLGDDRLQPLGQRLRFRLSGLSHLLAVSGQNVAFVLAVARPVLGALGHRARLLAVLALVVLFAVVTRLEPSVLRAAATASVAAWASWSGRSRSGLAVLAVAVAGLIVVDPFLVDAVGFQLSVAASAGILMLGPPLARRLPGPETVVQALSTTIAAQAGVAPVLSAHFGPMSLVAVPANLAAGWAAAGVMTWGMSVGIVAGMLPSGVAAIVQLPARVMLWWLEVVATAGAALPGPRPGPVLLLAVVAVVVVGRGLRPRWLAGAAGLVVLIVIASTVPRAPALPMACGVGITWFPGDEEWPRSVLVVGREAGPGGLEDCLAQGIRVVDLVIVERGDRHAGRLLAGLQEVMRVGEVWAPPQHVVVGARRRLAPILVETGTAMLVVTPDDDGHMLRIATTARVEDATSGTVPVSPPGLRSGGEPHP